MSESPDHRTVRFWLIRHAPVINIQSRFPDAQGDADLSDKATLGTLADALGGDALWVTSPWPRARQTAEALLSICGRSSAGIIPEHRFTEQNFGLWAGLSHHQAARKNPGLYREFWKDPAQTTPPEGESFATQIKRVKDGLRSLMMNRLSVSQSFVKTGRKNQKTPHRKNHPPRDTIITPQTPATNIVIITHAGTIRAALATALECSAQSALHFHLDCLSLTCLDCWIDDPATLSTNGSPAGWKVDQVNHRYPSGLSSPSTIARSGVTLVFGGIRSGKSAHAESLILQITGKDQTPIYIATADPALSATDQQMQKRIEHHRQRRGNRWRLIEEPDHLPECLKALAADQESSPPILIDSITLWLANRITKNTMIESEIDQLCQALTQTRSPVILVSDEVGLGGVAAHRAARDFADQVGHLNARLADLCDRVILVTAGLATTLKT